MTREQKFSDALAVQVERRIFLVRGQKVMLDADLAMLYGVEPRGLNQAVARNRKRFPADFVFQLSARDYDALTSQIVISNKDDAWVISGWPVQFIPPTSPLVEEALANAAEMQVDGLSARVFTPEYLAAIALQ